MRQAKKGAVLFLVILSACCTLVLSCGSDNKEETTQLRNEVSELKTQVASNNVATPARNPQQPVSNVAPTVIPPTATPAPPPNTFKSSDGVYELLLEATTWGGVYSEGGADWKPMIRFSMRYKYHGTTQHFLRYSKTDFRLRDDRGNEYKITGDLYLFQPCGACQYQKNLGGTMDGNTNEAVFILPFGGEGTSGPNLAQGARTLTLSVDNFNGRIPHAEWKIQIP